MEKYLSGRIQRIEDLPDGSSFIFNFRQEARLGFMVRYADDRCGILDINAMNIRGEEYPAIYKIENFSREKVLFLEKARIVPTIEPSTLGFGYHERGRSTKALYLIGEELIVQAILGEIGVRINMEVGRLTKVDISFGMYCTHWRVEAPNADGDYRTVVEFTA